MKELLDLACKKYYEGNPIMSDDSFDYLADKYNYNYVGYEQTDDSIPHPFRMYSLQKVYEGEGSIDLPEPIAISPKLDGAAISLIYIEGKLSLALSRGDGIRGKDVTRNVAHLVPDTIDAMYDVTQITGEVVAPKYIKNARNYAAGALNLKEPEERDLTFIAYGIEPNTYFHWITDMEELTHQGFLTVLDSDWGQFPQDGLVYRADRYDHFNSLGYTSKHPRGAFALKKRAEGIVTKLLDVVWQVGKSGVVSPVAILEPVEIGGATVSRATLHI